MSGDDDPRNPGPVSPGGGAGAEPEIVVPDDLSELGEDIAAYHREVRAAHRRARRRERRAAAPPALRWLLPPGREPAIGFSGRPQRRALPFTITAASLAIAAIVTVLLTVLAPRPELTNRPSRPLATTTVAAGQPGGLLPDLTLQTATGSARLRGLRPAVILSLPAHCGCADTVSQISQDADSAHVPTAAVTHAPAASAAPVEAQEVSTITAYNDPLGGFAADFGGGALAAVVVGPDGRVASVLTGSQITRDLATALQAAFDAS